MFSVFAPAPAQPLLPAEQIDPTYVRLRRQVFLGIFIGYAAYYLVRKNLALGIPDILREHPEYTKADLGTALTALAMSYGLSKFLMGAVSDRSNPRWFMPVGLLISSGLMFICGGVKAVYESLWVIIALQILIGWFNGMGWPPCGKTMVHWFSTKERGRTVALWNIAHNIGGGLVATLAFVGVAWSGDWGAKFWFNAAIASIIALTLFYLLRDTPQSCGLPPVEVWKNDFPAGYSEAHETHLTTRQIFLGHIFNNGHLWCIALANVFAYFIRYGVVDWVPTYLQTAKNFDFKASSIAWAAFEYSAIPGTLLCGYISDRWFRGHRAPATILFMALTLIALLVYSMNRHGPLWIDIASLIAIGFFIYGPIMLIGLHALDLVPKKAAGTAAGFTGFFGYVFGTAVAGTGVGWIAQHFDWTGVFSVMIVCCVLTMAFSALTLLPKRAS
jgi:MFS transporter, OPA family, glycerol-3-phosphate transporter